MRSRYRRYIFLLIFLSVIGILYFLPVSFQFTFRSNSLIYPAKMWNLRTDLEGNFFGEVKNYRTGVIESSISYRFERGDITNLQLNESLNRNPVIQKGDTIGLLSSRLIEERIEQLENQIAIDKRLLESSKTGEKEEIIKNLQQKMLLAEQLFDLAKKNYDRIDALHKEGVVPSNEFETAETEYNTALTNIEIARSNYAIAQTGQKPEALSVIEERILRQKREIAFLNTTQQKYLIVSPLAGKLVVNQYVQTQGDYISIYDTSEYIIYAPVKYRFRPYLDANMKVTFMIQNTEEVIEAVVFKISDRVDNVSGHQVVFVKASVIPSTETALAGLSVQLKFHGEPVTLREYIRRTIEIFIR